MTEPTGLSNWECMLSWGEKYTEKLCGHFYFAGSKVTKTSIPNSTVQEDKKNIVYVGGAAVRLITKLAYSSYS